MGCKAPVGWPCSLLSSTACKSGGKLNWTEHLGLTASVWQTDICPLLAKDQRESQISFTMGNGMFITSLLCLAIASHKKCCFIIFWGSAQVFILRAPAARQAGNPWSPVNPIQQWKVFSNPSMQYIMLQGIAGVLPTVDIYWKGRNNSKGIAVENWGVKDSPPSAKGPKPT